MMYNMMHICLWYTYTKVYTIYTCIHVYMCVHAHTRIDRYYFGIFDIEKGVIQKQAFFN
jgi:hypothetical protein